jgi:hypothetical protein
MDESDIVARVRAAGLEKAWEAFPQDVRDAANLAERQGRALHGDGLSPADEPWPPMRKADPA